MANVKAIFETIAKEATCNLCHEIIWNSPIFNSVSGAIFCETCTKLVANAIFRRNFGLERSLLAFETDCKYKRDGCIIRKGPHNIFLHEEECEFRMVPCPIRRECKQKYSFQKIFEHLLTRHEHINDEFSLNVCHESVFYGSFFITSQFFGCLVVGYIYTKAFICDQNFIVQMKFCEKNNIVLIWVRLMESKFQAKYINYKIEVQGPNSKVSFEGSVRSIDENIHDIDNSQDGLIMPFANIKKFLQEDRLHFSVEIKDLKSKEDLIAFESENYESKEPLKKKFKSEKTE